MCLKRVFAGLGALSGSLQTPQSAVAIGQSGSFCHKTHIKNLANGEKREQGTTCAAANSTASTSKFTATRFTSVKKSHRGGENAIFVSLASLYLAMAQTPIKVITETPFTAQQIRNPNKSQRFISRRSPPATSQAVFGEQNAIKAAKRGRCNQ